MKGLAMSIHPSCGLKKVISYEREVTSYVKHTCHSPISKRRRRNAENLVDRYSGIRRSRSTWRSQRIEVREQATHSTGYTRASPRGKPNSYYKRLQARNE